MAKHLKQNQKESKQLKLELEKEAKARQIAEKMSTNHKETGLLFFLKNFCCSLVSFISSFLLLSILNKVQSKDFDSLVEHVIFEV